jgi:hypothetical protein
MAISTRGKPRLPAASYGSHARALVGGEVCDDGDGVVLVGVEMLQNERLE